MTVATERFRAIRYLRDAAKLIFKRGKDRPKLHQLRFAFHNALRHYPSDFDIERIAECPRCKKILENENGS